MSKPTDITPIDVYPGADVTEHKDGRGETARWPCGCSVVRRGDHFTRRFCTGNGHDILPERMPDEDPATDG